MAKMSQDSETVEMLRPRWEIGPATKLFVVLNSVGCVLTLLVPEWTIGFLAQNNPELFGAMRIWTPFTGTVVIDSLMSLGYVLCIVLFILRHVEISLRPKWFWIYWFTTTLIGALAGWVLMPQEVFLDYGVPPMAACGATWWLCRSERWNVWGIEMKARTGIVVAVLLGVVMPLANRQFGDVAACSVALVAGYAFMRLLEWREQGFPHSGGRQRQEKSHYIELD